jgi:hypothetical protein
LADASGHKEQDLKLNVAQFIESVRDKLLTGKVIYEDEIGLTEIQG